MPLPFNRKKGKRIPSGVLEGMDRTARSSKSEFLQSNDRGAIHQSSTRGVKVRARKGCFPIHTCFALGNLCAAIKNNQKNVSKERMMSATEVVANMPLHSATVRVNKHKA
ncbi:hypothetical protein GBB04_11915, partial [Bifidobacterium dentium]